MNSIDHGDGQHAAPFLMPQDPAPQRTAESLPSWSTEVAPRVEAAEGQPSPPMPQQQGSGMQYNPLSSESPKVTQTSTTKTNTLSDRSKKPSSDTTTTMSASHPLSILSSTNSVTGGELSMLDATVAPQHHHHHQTPDPTGDLARATSLSSAKNEGETTTFVEDHNKEEQEHDEERIRRSSTGTADQEEVAASSSSTQRSPSNHHHDESISLDEDKQDALRSTVVARDAATTQNNNSRNSEDKSRMDVDSATSSNSSSSSSWQAAFGQRAIFEVLCEFLSTSDHLYAFRLAIAQTVINGMDISDRCLKDRIRGRRVSVAPLGPFLLQPILASLNRLPPQQQGKSSDFPSGRVERAPLSTAAYLTSSLLQIVHIEMLHEHVLYVPGLAGTFFITPHATGAVTDSSVRMQRLRKHFSLDFAPLEASNELLDRMERETEQIPSSCIRGTLLGGLCNELVSFPFQRKCTVPFGTNEFLVTRHIRAPCGGRGTLDAKDPLLNIARIDGWWLPTPPQIADPFLMPLDENVPFLIGGSSAGRPKDIDRSPDGLAIVKMRQMLYRNAVRPFFPLLFRNEVTVMRESVPGAPVVQWSVVIDNILHPKDQENNSPSPSRSSLCQVSVYPNNASTAASSHLAELDSSTIPGASVLLSAGPLQIDDDSEGNVTKTFFPKLYYPMMEERSSGLGSFLLVAAPHVHIRRFVKSCSSSSVWRDVTNAFLMNKTNSSSEAPQSSSSLSIRQRFAAARLTSGLVPTVPCLLVFLNGMAQPIGCLSAKPLRLTMSLRDLRAQLHLELGHAFPALDSCVIRVYHRKRHNSTGTEPVSVASARSIATTTSTANLAPASAATNAVDAHMEEQFCIADALPSCGPLTEMGTPFGQEGHVSTFLYGNRVLAIVLAPRAPMVSSHNASTSGNNNEGYGGSLATSGSTRVRNLRAQRAKESLKEIHPALQLYYVTVGAALDAVRRGDLTTLEQLLKGTTGTSASTTTSGSAWKSAQSSGRLPSDLPRLSSTDDSAMLVHCAAEFGRKDVLQWLISQNYSVVTSNSDRQTPLHLCALRGHAECIPVLLRADVARKTLNQRDSQGRTPLHLALYAKLVNTALWLVEQGADMNVPDATGKTAADYACTLLPTLSDHCRSGNVEEARWLLNGALRVECVAAVTDEATASQWYLQVLTHRLTCARLLFGLRNRCDVHSRSGTPVRNVLGLSALHIAILNGKLAIVKLLLTEPYRDLMDVYERTACGDTVMHLAARSPNSLELFRVLLEVFETAPEGPAPILSSVNHRGETPLHVALLGARKSSSSAQCLHYLLSRCQAEPSVYTVERLGHVFSRVLDERGFSVVHCALCVTPSLVPTEVLNALLAASLSAENTPLQQSAASAVERVAAQSRRASAVISDQIALDLTPPTEVPGDRTSASSSATSDNGTRMSSPTLPSGPPVRRSRFLVLSAPHERTDLAAAFRDRFPHRETHFHSLHDASHHSHRSPTKPSHHHHGANTSGSVGPTGGIPSRSLFKLAVLRGSPATLRLLADFMVSCVLQRLPWPITEFGSLASRGLLHVAYLRGDLAVFRELLSLQTRYFTNELLRPYVTLDLSTVVNASLDGNNVELREVPVAQMILQDPSSGVWIDEVVSSAVLLDSIRRADHAVFELATIAQTECSPSMLSLLVDSINEAAAVYKRRKHKSKPIPPQPELSPYSRQAPVVHLTEEQKIRQLPAEVRQLDHRYSSSEKESLMIYALRRCLLAMDPKTYRLSTATEKALFPRRVLYAAMRCRGHPASFSILLAHIDGMHVFPHDELVRSSALSIQYGLTPYAGVEFSFLKEDGRMFTPTLTSQGHRLTRGSDAESLGATHPGGNGARRNLSRGSTRSVKFEAPIDVVALPEVHSFDLLMKERETQLCLLLPHIAVRRPGALLHELCVRRYFVAAMSLLVTATTNAHHVRGKSQTTQDVVGAALSSSAAMLLRDSNVDLRAPELEEYSGVSALHVAAQFGVSQLVQALLRTGQFFAREASPVRKWTPMHWAARYGHLQCCRTLLSVGVLPSDTADPISDRLGSSSPQQPARTLGTTPLHLAAASGSIDVARLLLEYGAQADARSLTGRSPLHLAARKGHTDIVLMLLEAGASLDREDDEGHTPLLLAAEEGHGELILRIVAKTKRETLLFSSNRLTGTNIAHYCAWWGPCMANVLRQIIETSASARAMEISTNRSLNGNRPASAAAPAAGKATNAAARGTAGSEASHHCNKYSMDESLLNPSFVANACEGLKPGAAALAVICEDSAACPDLERYLHNANFASSSMMQHSTRSLAAGNSSSSSSNAGTTFGFGGSKQQGSTAAGLSTWGFRSKTKGTSSSLSVFRSALGISSAATSEVPSKAAPVVASSSSSPSSQVGAKSSTTTTTQQKGSSPAPSSFAALQHLVNATELRRKQSRDSELFRNVNAVALHANNRCQASLALPSSFTKVLQSTYVEPGNVLTQPDRRGAHGWWPLHYSLAAGRSEACAAIQSAQFGSTVEDVLLDGQAEEERLQREEEAKAIERDRQDAEAAFPSISSLPGAVLVPTTAAMQHQLQMVQHRVFEPLPPPTPPPRMWHRGYYSRAPSLGLLGILGHCSKDASPVDYTSIVSASKSRVLSALSWLLRRGVADDVSKNLLLLLPNVDEPIHPSGMTLSMLAAYYGQIPSMQLLLDMGANINRAARYRQKELEEDGMRPLLAASISGNTKMVEFLIEHHAEVDVADECGNTPVHQAVLHEDFDMLKALLHAGAAINAVNSAGDTAEDIAVALRLRDTVRMLRWWNMAFSVEPSDFTPSLVPCRTEVEHKKWIEEALVYFKRLDTLAPNKHAGFACKDERESVPALMYMRLCTRLKVKPSKSVITLLTPYWWPEEVKALHLQGIFLDDSQYTAFFTMVKLLPHLEELEISDGKLQHVHVEQLFVSCVKHPHIRRLNLTGNRMLGRDSAVKLLALIHENPNMVAIDVPATGIEVPFVLQLNRQAELNMKALSLQTQDPTRPVSHAKRHKEWHLPRIDHSSTLPASSSASMQRGARGADADGEDDEAAVHMTLTY